MSYCHKKVLRNIIDARENLMAINLVNFLDHSTSCRHIGSHLPVSEYNSHHLFPCVKDQVSIKEYGKIKAC